MSAFIIYKRNITNPHLADFIYSDYYFSQSGCKAFYSYTITKGIDMLPKRSTPVDQILGSESIHSQLSVAIFTAPRNLLGARNDSIYEKKCQKDVNPCFPPVVSKNARYLTMKVVSFQYQTHGSRFLSKKKFFRFTNCFETIRL